MATIKPYTLALTAFLAGSAAGSGIMATAAPGDQVYHEPGNQQCIAQADAVCYAQCAIDAGLWTGAAVDMTDTKARRSPGCESGFSAEVSGWKTASPAEINAIGKPVLVEGAAE